MGIGQKQDMNDLYTPNESAVIWVILKDIIQRYTIKDVRLSEVIQDYTIGTPTH